MEGERGGGMGEAGGGEGLVNMLLRVCFPV